MDKMLYHRMNLILSDQQVWQVLAYIILQWVHNNIYTCLLIFLPSTNWLLYLFTLIFSSICYFVVRVIFRIYFADVGGGLLGFSHYLFKFLNNFTCKYLQVYSIRKCVYSFLVIYLHTVCYFYRNKKRFYFCVYRMWSWCWLMWLHVTYFGADKKLLLFICDISNKNV